MPRKNSSRAPIAIIDIGSNSGRVVVLQRDEAGHLRLLAGSRAPLRLVHDVDERRSLSEESMARTMEAVRDFHAIAVGAGATRIVAVATAAMRDARNGQVFRDRIRRELGIRVDIIDGRAEARFGFAGAVRGLAVSSGMWFDLGGGSIQVAPFKSRKLGPSTSLALGALRLSETFLQSDPPKPRELRRLRDHVRAQLKKSKLSRLRPDEELVGTGGTLRNLAKIDRSQHPYPVGSLHGYILSFERLREVVRRLATTRQKHRDAIAGLSAERADSVVGGAVAIEVLMELVRAQQVVVSGQGVREGIAQSVLKMRVASERDVKEVSLASLASRFDSWHPEAAARRRATAATLLRSLEPGADAALAQALDRGARLLDIGTSLDFFERHEHVADMLLATELDGFTHEEIALVSGLVRLAGDRHADLEPLSPLVTEEDRARLDRGAVVLALADAIERRCPRGQPIAVSCAVGRVVTVSVPLLSAWHSRELGPRFERAFGKALVVKTG